MTVSGCITYFTGSVVSILKVAEVQIGMVVYNIAMVSVVCKFFRYIAVWLSGTKAC